MINSKSQVLLHLIDYLTDENIGKLICYFYGIKDYTNPYNSHREMLINIVSDNPDNFVFYKISRREFNEDFRELYLSACDDCSNLSNNVYKSDKGIMIDKFCRDFGFPNYTEFNKLKHFNEAKRVEYMHQMFSFYDKQLPLSDFSKNDNLFKKFLLEIVDIIRSFDIRVKSNDKSRYKRYLNNIVERIIEQNEIYKFTKQDNKNILLKLHFYNTYKNSVSIMVKDEITLLEIQNGVYILGTTENYKIDGISTIEYKDKSTHSLIGSPDTTNFDKKLDEIDKAVNKYLNTEKTCKMCGRPYSKAQRCDDCQELMDVIFKDNKDRFKNHKYNVKYAIEKLKYSDESYTLVQKRKERYNNVKLLLKDVKISNKKHIEELVNKMFGDIEPFYI